MSADLDLAELRKIAEAATANAPWWRYYAVRSGVRFEHDDAVYISAFDPPTALALLDRLEAAESRLLPAEGLLRSDHEVCLPRAALDGLQELGQELGVWPGQRITGTEALEAVKALRERAEAAEAALTEPIAVALHYRPGSDGPWKAETVPVHDGGLREWRERAEAAEAAVERVRELVAKPSEFYAPARVTLAVEVDALHSALDGEQGGGE